MYESRHSVASNQINMSESQEESHRDSGVQQLKKQKSEYQPIQVESDQKPRRKTEQVKRKQQIDELAGIDEEQVEPKKVISNLKQARDLAQKRRIQQENQFDDDEVSDRGKSEQYSQSFATSKASSVKATPEELMA